jgi:geranylgeranylglycerol-phosphate geranylgeranyltransferase
MVKRPPTPSAAVHPALRLVRAGNLGVSFAGTIVGGLAGRGSGLSGPLGFWVAIALAAASTSLVTAGGNVLNDLLDLEGDRTNHPDRPLVTGAISLPSARALVVVLFLGGVLVAIPVILLQPLVGVLLAVAVAALLGYEFRLKARGFVGNAIVGFLTGMVFLYGGAAAGHALLLAPFAAMAFFATLSREVIKDMEDVAGDVGRRTLPRTRGLGFASHVAEGSVLVAVALSFVPLLWFVPADSVVGIMYGLLVLAADAIFLLSISRLPSRLHWKQTMSKAGMSVALLAFVVVAFR